MVSKFPSRSYLEATFDVLSLTPFLWVKLVEDRPKRPEERNITLRSIYIVCEMYWTNEMAIILNRDFGKRVANPVV
jgi:hypothetical protein